jgi:hypothetical protein
MGRAQALPGEIVVAVRQAAIGAVSSVMRVEVTGDVGYLFFLEGELVHASTLELEGESAATTIVGWGEGELAWCERRWPAERTVFLSSSELCRVPAAPPVRIEPEPPTSMPELAEPTPLTAEVHFPSSFALRQTLSRAEFKNALRLSSGGDVGESRGSTAHLKPVLLASLTLGDSLGAALGLGPLVAAEASAPGFHRLVMRSAEDASAAESAGGNALQLARAFLKL